MSLADGMGIGDFALSLRGKKPATHSAPKTTSSGQLDIENVEQLYASNDGSSTTTKRYGQRANATS